VSAGPETAGDRRAGGSCPAADILH
jgi:hypothetical protein